MIYSAIVEEKQKHCKEIQTNSLIALCEMENYDKFCQELESLIASEENKDLIYKVYNIMQGNLTIGNKKLKNFVKKYQDIIEIMKKYHCLSDMTIYKYHSDGKPDDSSNEDYFFKFISEHKEDIETIKNIAIKIKNLGFDKIIYGEKLDFTDVEYQLDTLYGSDIKFLENIDVIPTYNLNPIIYKTNDSCYCMTVGTFGYGNKKISDYGREIELNSLIFDPQRLPNEITVESTIGTIIKLVENSKKEYQIIKDSVDMSIFTEDLMIQYNRTKNIIESIENLKNKEEIKQILHNILREITELKLASLSFENEIIDCYEKIDEDKMEDEKKLYLKRRQCASNDID
jgi:hypothetical protein